MSIKEIRNVLKETYPFLQSEDLNLFLQICEYKMLPKRTSFISAGQKSNKAFFILAGMVRGYFVNSTGEEKNIFLRPEWTITGAPECLFLDQVTQYTFEMVIDSHLLVFNFKKLEDLASKNPSIFKLHNKALQENLLTLAGRVRGLIDYTPEERYEQLLNQSPHFFQSALSKHVANYLGITPSSLSRIINRKRKT